jgi:SAM-dependent methyltransferase
VTNHKEWFEQWFDSPYYHVLYSERNEKEAQLFLDKLINHLDPTVDAKILDVACGKGRHSVYLNQKGFDVTGFDLSPENIEYDLQFENDKLTFFKHDMREIFRINYYDYVFNLFSSFGYFSNERDNAKTIEAHAYSLKPGGKLVLDYLNASKVRATFIPESDKTIKGITFHLSKKIEGCCVVKAIDFTDRGQHYNFHERLWLYSKNDFEKFFSGLNLKLTDTFGDYQLNAFEKQSSDRLIMIAEKK